MKTKLFAAFLAVCMVFSLMPVAAFATDEVALTVTATKVSDGSAEVTVAGTVPEGATYYYKAGTGLTALTATSDFSKIDPAKDEYSKLITTGNDANFEDGKFTVDGAKANDVVNVIAATETYDENTKENTYTVVAWGSVKLEEADTEPDPPAENTYTVSVTKPQNGTVEVKNGTTVLTATDEVAKDTKLTIAATPATGYVLNTIKVVYGDNEEVEVKDNSFTMPAGNVTVTVTFKNGPVTLTITTPQNGTLTATVDDEEVKNGAKVAYGSNIVITATPATDYKLAELSVDGKGVNTTTNATTGTATYTITNVAKDTTVAATFKPKTYTITANKPANGSVAIKVGSETPTEFAKGEQVTVVATPNKGYELDKIEATDADGNPVTVSKDGKFTMPAGNVTVKVTFKLKSYTLTLTNPTGGTIAVTADGKDVEFTEGEAKVDYGALLKVTATAGANYKFASLTVGNNTYKEATYTGNAVSDLTISATFTPVYKVTLTQPTDKDGKPNGSVKFTDVESTDPKAFAAGETVSLTVTPPAAATEGADVITTVSAKQGSKDVAVTSKGDNVYTFTMPAGAVTVEVSFNEAKIELGSQKIDEDISGKAFEDLTDDNKTALTTALKASAVTTAGLDVEAMVDSDADAKEALTAALGKADPDATVEMVVFPQVSPVAYKPAQNTMTVDVSMMYKIVTTDKDGKSDEETAKAETLEVESNFTIAVKIGVPADIGAANDTVYVTHRGETTSATVQAGGFINVTLKGLSDVIVSKTTDAVASITANGETNFYKTLEAAIAAVAKDATATIVLLENVTLSKDITVTEPKTITISTKDDSVKFDKATFDIKGGEGIAVNESGDTYKFTAKKQNTITITESDGYSKIEVKPNPAYEGDKVTVTVTPAGDNTVEKVMAGSTEATKDGGGYTFTMPGTPVTVTVIFKGDEQTTPPEGEGGGGGGGGGTPAASPVTVEKAENGKVTATPANAAAGTTVTVNATPDEGCVVDQVKVVDKDGKTVPVTKGTDGKYSFKMPEGGATVTATFKKNPNPVNGFTDVKAGDWFVDAVKYVYDNNLMVGTSDTTFSPAKPVTRAEAAMILYKMNGSPSVAGLSNKFPDVQLGQWYTDAVLWCAANGKMVGYDDGSFGVSDVVTREQIALIFMRQMGGGGRDDLSGFNDAGQVSSWALEGMQWAVANDIINGNGVGLDPRGDTLRCSMAQVLMKTNATAG